MAIVPFKPEEKKAVKKLINRFFRTAAYTRWLQVNHGDKEYIRRRLEESLRTTYPKVDRPDVLEFAIKYAKSRV